MRAPERERRHPTEGGDEGHRLIAGSLVEGVDLVVQVRRLPDGTISYAAIWWPVAADPVVLAETGVRDDGRSWEIRHDGLWAEQICEVPFEHWSYGLEAFALELDDPEALIGNGLGRRVAFGFELDFVAHGPLLDGARSDVQTGLVSGVVMLGVDQHELRDWPAHRSHWWDGDVPSTPVSGVGAIAVPDTDRTFWLARDEFGVAVSDRRPSPSPEVGT